MSDEPAAPGGWGPERYEVAREALGYLTANFFAIDGSAAEDELRRILMDSPEKTIDGILATAIRLVSGMTNIAVVLTVMRARDQNIMPPATLDELGRIFNPPSPPDV